MRQLKQLLYAIFYIFVWAVIIYGVYFFVFRIPPTCTDGKKNGSEKGIDCGGKCINACLPPALQSIRVSESLKILPLSGFPGERRASLFFEVQNPNVQVAAKTFPFTIKFYGPSSAFLDAFSGYSYIYEREVKNIVLPNVSLPQETVYGEVTIGMPEWVSAENFAKPALSVLDVKLTSAEGWIRAEGTVVNRDTILLPVVTINALFYGKQGGSVALSTLELERLEPHKPRTFSVAHPYDPGIDLNRAPRVTAEAVRP